MPIPPLTVFPTVQQSTDQANFPARSLASVNHQKNVYEPEVGNVITETNAMAVKFNTASYKDFPKDTVIDTLVYDTSSYSSTKIDALMSALVVEPSSVYSGFLPRPRFEDSRVRGTVNGHIMQFDAFFFDVNTTNGKIKIDLSFDLGFVNAQDGTLWYDLVIRGYRSNGSQISQYFARIDGTHSDLIYKDNHIEIITDFMAIDTYSDAAKIELSIEYGRNWDGTEPTKYIYLDNVDLKMVMEIES